MREEELIEREGEGEGIELGNYLDSLQGKRREPFKHRREENNGNDRNAL